MPIFEYKAVDATGKVVKDKIELDGNENDARQKLLSLGLKPMTVKKAVFDLQALIEKARPQQKNKKAAISFGENDEVIADEVRKAEANKKKRASVAPKKKKDILKKEINLNLDLSAFDIVKYDDVISFTQMFLLLKKANFTNMRAMTAIYSNNENGAMKRILEDIINGLEAGNYIYSTMEYYKKVFPEIYVNMIKVGELSGSLVNSLEQALKYLEDSKRIKTSVRKALVGPLFQSIALIIGAIVAIIFGIPVLENMYASYGLTDQIPEETMAVSNAINWTIDHWYIVLGVIAGIVALFIAWKSTSTGRYAWDKFKISLPIFGQLILKLQLQKFFVAVQINLKNNARLQDALSVSKNVLSNTVVLAAIEAAESNLIVGDSWIEPFETMPKFPPMLLEMLRIGMETDMNEMITNVLSFMEEDIQITINRITKVLPNVSMALMGVVLIGFVIVVLRPIMDVYMGSFLFESYGIS